VFWQALCGTVNGKNMTGLRFDVQPLLIQNFLAVVTNNVFRSRPPKQRHVGLVAGTGMTVSMFPSGR
jgi:hypothetical protein